MHYIVVIVSKRDICDRYWKEFCSEGEAKKYFSIWDTNQYTVRIFKGEQIFNS